MPSFLQVDHISKSYGEKILFEDISFNVNEGDKIALVAPNGTGKTTLLGILAGKGKSDSGGSVKFLRDVRIAFLEQEYAFNASLTVAAQLAAKDFEQELSQRKILSELGIAEDRLMGSLSGGEVKRVAIAQMLSCGADFYIMDEPTNHLDLEGIEYLENALKKSRCTLFMVTHDRYFLDRVCNTVMEMDRGEIFTYRGDYSNYLEKRTERITNFNAQTDKVRNILQRELEWIHATPCARSGKAKYRKDAFVQLKERAAETRIDRSISMAAIGGAARTLGTKVIDCKHLSFGYGDSLLVDDFSYKFARGERVGIVGENGIGKSTFLNLLVEGEMPSIERGESLQVGYYRQRGIEFNDEDTVLDVVPDTRLLEKFLFPRDMFNTRVSRLSGGEKRRLYLLTVLMQGPNMLVLDEPTNDLDIVTLNVLEEYLMDFKGTLVVVTHDRHFLDRIVDHLFVFCGGGLIKDFIGGYTEYRSFITDLRAEKRREERAAAEAKVGAKARTSDAHKLSFKEKRELEELEGRIAALEEEKAGLEAILQGTAPSGAVGSSASPADITAASVRYQALQAELDEAETRWLELSI